MFTDFELLERKIGYEFNNKELLCVALTHSSYINDHKLSKIMDYERMEFLGDAVLELVTSEYLYKEFPNKNEGNMTKTRASMVCEKALATAAREIGLGKFIRLGFGEEKSGGRQRESIIADVIESIIGAIYLDSGLEEAKKFIHRFILDDFENKSIFYDCKSTLQELVQKNNTHHLEYIILSQSGPDHNKTFEAAAVLDGSIIGQGTGRTKKDAQQNAAYAAILDIKSRKVL
ncbi:MAG: ribonuclease III [Lachnospiraceae bacterium]|nr:ribonuclease III [Lachnospiraceae bacterium]MBQ4069040.1 ribonuclease III [Lachnospiraceae bacterium]